MAQWRIHVYLLGALVMHFAIITGQKRGDKTTVEVRLVGGLSETRDGRVEIKVNDTVWGTICDDDWDINDAAVICRMLGYVGVARAHEKGFFGPGTGQIWMDSVNCAGDETSLTHCPFLGWGVTDCNHDEDAGVTCLGERSTKPTSTLPTRRPSTTTLPPRICDNPSTDIRLMDGPTDAQGRVQFRRNGVWGDICDDRWGMEDAKVVCKMLCYNPENARAHLGGKYGNATSPYLLDEVQCLGTERTISDCPKNPWGVHNCEIEEAAGVSCIQDDPGLPGLPDPTIVCENSVIEVVFDRMHEPRLETRFLSVVGASPSCDYQTKMTVNDVIMQIPFIGCGTSRRENQTHILYENNIRHAVPAPSDVVTRTTVYYIPVICVMPRSGDPENNLQPEARTAPPARGRGKFDVKMFFYLNNRFVEPVERFPAQVVLGETVYVAMSLLSTDRGLKLIIPLCWATPEKEPESTPRIDLITDKCIREDSVNFYPINDTTFAFRFTSFKFLGNFPYTYIHCDGYICGLTEKTPQCDRSCGTPDPKRRKRQASGLTLPDSAKPYFYDVNQGPLVFLESTEDALLEEEVMDRRAEERGTLMRQVPQEPSDQELDTQGAQRHVISISASGCLHMGLISTLLSLLAVIFIL